MKPNRFFIMILAFTLLVAGFAIGCTPARRPIVDRNPDYNQDNIADEDLNMTRRTPGTTPAPGTLPNDNIVNDRVNPTREMDMTIDRQMEIKIADDLERIQGINDAIVIVNGNTAYVGVDAGRNIEGTRLNNLKDQVIRRVRTAEPRITRVYVSADLDVMERLRGYDREIRGGRPISGFIEEIEELFRRPLPRS